MSKPLTYAHRRLIVRLRQKGRRFNFIAQEVCCSVRTAQRIWSQYQKEGEQGLHTKYERGGRKKIYNIKTWERVCQIRDCEQGAPYIRSVLLEKYPQMRVPHERTIQRHWACQGQNRPKGRPKKKSSWSQEPGHTYQIDGKDQIELGNQQNVSWMKVADEASGTDLSTKLFSL